MISATITAFTILLCGRSAVTWNGSIRFQSHVVKECHTRHKNCRLETTKTTSLIICEKIEPMPAATEEE
ncbi:unnamed protein product [marine sediment metagenome]|uniref:Uncharacterized protein n=1 Tax=marine sediment metagenome TaxID=412755 RepID=X0VC99_9ZZZZ